MTRKELKKKVGRTSKKVSGNDLYDFVVSENDGVTRKDVRNLFVWYDLLSYILPFQLIFIIICLNGSKNFAMTIFSACFIFAMDAILKNSLERDGKNFQKFYKNLSLIKLWVIPLTLTGIITMVILIITTLGAI